MKRKRFTSANFSPTIVVSAAIPRVFMPTKFTILERTASFAPSLASVFRPCRLADPGRIIPKSSGSFVKTSATATSSKAKSDSANVASVSAAS